MSTPAPWRRLLVYVDDPQQETQLLQQAASLAQHWQAELHLLMVMDQRELNHLARASEQSPAQVEQLARQHLLSVLQPLLQSLSCPAEFSLQCGRPFLEILRYVDRHQIDLVFKATSQHHRWQRGLLCSLDQHLLRKCPAAVWLQPLSASPDGNNIIASVDFADADSQERDLLDDLNQRVLSAAACLAETWTLPLQLIHAWDAPAADVIRYWVDDPQADDHAARYASSCEQRAKQGLGELADGVQRHHSGLDCREVLRRGDARQVIAEQTQMLNPRVLIMGTVGRSHLAGLLIGNTAEDVLNQVSCAVLALKPSDFVCPITLE
jgi:nucleotide-binding universal stress UspA family protein